MFRWLRLSYLSPFVFSHGLHVPWERCHLNKWVWTGRLYFMCSMVVVEWSMPWHCRQNSKWIDIFLGIGSQTLTYSERCQWAKRSEASRTGPEIGAWAQGFHALQVGLQVGNTRADKEGAGEAGRQSGLCLLTWLQAVGFTFYLLLKSVVCLLCWRKGFCCWE